MKLVQKQKSSAWIRVLWRFQRPANANFNSVFPICENIHPCSVHSFFFCWVMPFHGIYKKVFFVVFLDPEDPSAISWSVHKNVLQEAFRGQIGGFRESVCVWRCRARLASIIIMVVLYFSVIQTKKGCWNGRYHHHGCATFSNDNSYSPKNFDLVEFDPNFLKAVRMIKISKEST